jgi:hypothetical protein
MKTYYLQLTASRLDIDVDGGVHRQSVGKLQRQRDEEYQNYYRFRIDCGGGNVSFFPEIGNYDGVRNLKFSWRHSTTSTTSS